MLKAVQEGYIYLLNKHNLSSQELEDRINQAKTTKEIHQIMSSILGKCRSWQKMKLDKDLQNQTASELVWIMSQEMPSEVAESWCKEDREEPLEELIQMYRNEQKAKSQSTYTPKQEALKMMPLVLPPQEMLKMTREFHLEVLELNNPSNKERLIEQINQAKTTEEMHHLIISQKMRLAKVEWEWDWENHKPKEPKFIK